MTPAAPLVGFCATMSAIAVGRLVTDENRDLVDVGSTLIVVGLTLLSAAWAALETTHLTVAGLLLATGGAIGCTGIGLMVRYWNEGIPVTADG